MESVTQIEEQVCRILGTRADELGRATGFIQRKRQVTGACFVQGLVFGWLHRPDARMEQLAQALGRAGTSISASGLSQRFTKAAQSLLEAIFQELVQLAVCVPAPERTLLSRFGAVIVEDSTQIGLPDALREHWSGCGNGNKPTQAGLKLHVQWDLLSGRLWGPVLTDGKLADQRSPLRERTELIPAGGVYITDTGYFGLRWLADHTDSEHYALTRPRANTAFYDEKGQRLDLCEIGPKAVGATLDLPVVVGRDVRWKARLIMVRVPEDVAESRRERIRRTAQRHSSAPNPLHLALAAWTILMTNVPPALLSTAEVVIMQRARWQIERLFRLWKEGGCIDEWRSKTSSRIVCELYGKLIGLLLQHWLLQLTCWADPRRSLTKASAVIRDFAWDLLRVAQRRFRLLLVVEEMRQVMGPTCRLDQRRKAPSTAQLLALPAADP